MSRCRGVVRLHAGVDKPGLLHRSWPPTEGAGSQTTRAIDKRRLRQAPAPLPGVRRQGSIIPLLIERQVESPMLRPASFVVTKGCNSLSRTFPNRHSEKSGRYRRLDFIPPRRMSGDGRTSPFGSDREGPESARRYWAAAAIDRAAATGRWARRKVRIWRTASGILSGVSFH